jgi:hypothetical protein
MMYIRKKFRDILVLSLILIVFGSEKFGAGLIAQVRLPDNPNSIAPAVDLYQYLDSLGKADSDVQKLIAGQWFGASFKPGLAGHYFQLGELNEIRRRSGKYLGFLDGWICPGDYGNNNSNDIIEDCMYYDEMIPEYILFWKNGGIVHTCATFFAPLGNDGWAERLDEGIVVDPDVILTEGTPENIQWRSICNRMSEFFLALQENNVPVIFRPFTEAYIDMYWYSFRKGKLGPEGFKRMYKDMWEYMTLVKGCNNILWDFQGNSSEAAYPGDEWVDILTSYSDYLAWGGNNQMKCNINQPEPYGNAELGDYGTSQRTIDKGKTEIPWNDWVNWNKENCRATTFYTKWWMNWGPVKLASSAGVYPDYDTGYNTALANPYIITREEITITPDPIDYTMTESLISDKKNWVILNGTWIFSKDELKRVDMANNGSMLFGNTDWADYSVEAMVQADAFGEAGLIGRASSTKIYYYASLTRNSIYLWRSFNGTLKNLGQAAGEFEVGKNYKLKLSFRGDEITVCLDQGTGYATMISALDSIIPAGCIGLISKNTQVVFTDIIIEKLSNAVNERMSLSGFESGLKVVPNPSSNEMHILSEEKINNLSLFGLNGQRVYMEAKSGEAHACLPKMTPGIYLLKVNTINGPSHAKVLFE